MLKIYTDTDTDITPAIAAEYGYTLISMPYSIDTKTTYPYVDFETFDAHAFYDILRGGVLPTSTASSSPTRLWPNLKPWPTWSLIWNSRK